NFYSLPIDALPNHTHSEYSSHFVVPLAINTTTGMVGNVFVTETMQFLMRGQSSTTWHIGYINNDSRQGATQTTTNNGGLWTSQNWTIDAHIHSYTGSEYYRYYVCANDTVGQQNCSSEGSDLIELGGMPPTPPVITYPIEGEYLSDKVITITYIPAVSPDGYDIVEYNITLLNTDETYNQTITANNSINLNYGWNLTGVSLGEYVLMVVACDNQSLCSYGLSNNFTIVEDTTPPNIDFNSQSPPDIESTNLYSQNVVVSYNISDQNGVDTTGVIIYYKTNSTLSNIFFYINGTEYSDYQTEANITNESDKWLFTLTDNQVYPGSYNIDQEGMVYTPHEFYRLNGSYSYIKTRFYNITSTGQYNTFEIMANKSSNNSNSLRTFYCNESYTSGSPINSRNCNNFYNIPYNPADWPNTLYNHTQSEYSSYHVIPLAINTTSGTIGQVVITPVSYFLVRTGGGWDVAHVSNLTRESTTQVSTNWGYNWNNFEGTIDAHVQQYNPLDTFTYYVCANDTYGNQNCSEERYDLIQQAGLPPSAPEIYQPIEGYYTNTIEINYTSSMSPNGYEIINYNISLLNPDETFNQTIIGNNGLDLGYLWDTATITSGEYMISVESCDNMTQCSYGLSENFTIDRIPLFEQIESFSKDEDFAQFTINLQNNVSDVEDIDNMLTYNWTLNDTNVFNLEIDNSTGVATFTALANVSGSVLVDISVVDTVGLSNSTEFTVTVDAVNDVPWIDQLANVSVDEDNGISAAYTSAELNNSFRDVEENQNPASLTLLSQSDTSAISCSIEDGVICTTVANQSGSNTLLIEMNDSGNETVREMVTITVGAIDDVPWIDQLSNITVDEDNGTTTIYTSTEINNSFRDVEEDQNPSSLTLLSQSNITPINCSIENGIVCDTAANETGSNTLTIEMNDSSNSAVRELVTVTVNPVNDSPWFDQVANITMDEDNGTTTIYTSTEINNSFRDVEEDQTPITITIYQSNTTAISCSVGNGVVCTTAANESGYNDLIFEMGDSEGSKINQTITITVNPINDAPWVELDRPYDNATNTTMNDIDFTYIPYDVENSISNCSLIINKEINLTSTNIAIGSMNNLTSHLPNAEYNWSINCTDSDNSIVASETRNVNITFDTIPPAVNLEDPLYDTSWTSSSTINFKYNVSDSSEINNCSLILNYDDVNSTSTSITKDIVGQTFSATLANAAYNWSINCTDENNNIGSSDVWNITINYVAPTTTPTTGGGTGGGAGGGGGVITKEPTINVIHTKQTFLKIDKETNIGIIIENPNTLKNLINVRITATSSNDKIKVTLNKNYIEKILPGENKEIRLTLENAEKTTGKIYITVEVQDPVITYTSEINIMAMLEEEITSPEEKPVEEEMPTAITKERDWTAVKWVGLLLGVTLLLYLLRMVKFKGMKKQKPKVKKKPKKRNLPELPF
ncbi:MAG: hypothetical protein QW404_01320, partial [Candidatus Nanoarchaeia archaeon]